MPSGRTKGDNETCDGGDSCEDAHSTYHYATQGDKTPAGAVAFVQSTNLYELLV